MDEYWLLMQQWDIVGAIIIVLVSIAIAIIVKYLLKFIAWRLAKTTKTELDDHILHALETPVVWGIIIGGLIASLYTIKSLQPYVIKATETGTTNYLDKVALVFGIIWATFTAVRLIGAIFRWYEKEIASKTKSDFDDRYLHIMQRVVNIFIYVMGFLVLLHQLGIQISPLLAGLGIGGLAVALALQDSLGNFFSGFYTMTERAIKLGDYVETDSGVKGHVKDINWRTSRIQTLEGNIVIMPNTKLAQSIVTNFEAPNTSIAVIIPIGVSYNSDLDKVEKVSIQVGKKVLQDLDELPKDFEPLVRFTEFADSSINYNMILRVKRHQNRFAVKHEFIKRLKKEFDKQKIEIPFPVRTVYMKK